MADLTRRDFLKLGHERVRHRRTPRYKCVFASDKVRELYDMGQDPLEWNNPPAVPEKRI